MFTFIIFIAVISVLVFVHEFGHFISAKRAGMRVDEFGFGFPPRIFGIKRGETIYSFNWIPFGGFVRIYGEDGGDRSDNRSFGSKPFWPRLGVILAGVAMNFLFAAFLLMLGNGIGLRIGLLDEADAARAGDKKVQIIEVAPESPAQLAGLSVFDEILGFKFQGGELVSIAHPTDVQDFVNAHVGQTVTMVIARNGDVLEPEVVLRKEPPPGQGPLGIGLALTGVVRYPWYQAIWRGIADAGILTVNTGLGYAALLGSLITKGKLIADVSGPIGIARMTGQAAQIGFSYLIQFVAMISINLAVLNVIPFPALDGGRAALLLAEKAKGRPLSRRTEGTINAVGFMVLIVLMILITARDISKLF